MEWEGGSWWWSGERRGAQHNKGGEAQHSKELQKGRRELDQRHGSEGLRADKPAEQPRSSINLGAELRG